MIRVNQIREQIASYVANEIPFAQFEDWLLSHSWNMHQDSPIESQRLVHEVKSQIYEYLDGYVDEPNLKAQLLPHVQRYNIRVVMPQEPMYQPSSSSQVEERQFEYA